MLSLEYISLSFAGFIEKIISSIASTSVIDFILDAILATHPGTSDEALGLEFSKGLFMHNKKKKEPLQEVGDHLAALGKALYQLCFYLATMFIIGGKLMFDTLHDTFVETPNSKRS